MSRIGPIRFAVPPPPGGWQRERWVPSSELVDKLAEDGLELAVSEEPDGWLVVDIRRARKSVC